ncbi:hypothetical protein [Natroniella sp. ANB-PHB2]|uniref:hypothetical protein n=1 Tax=Natroniella sp. ANB-PHB2 TaxID=3384444 RepID=UPI0038D3A26B
MFRKFKKNMLPLMLVLAAMLVIAGCSQMDTDFDAVEGQFDLVGNVLEDGTPIEGAVVEVGEKEAVTDEAGVFEIKALAEGEYDLFLNGELKDKIMIDADMTMVLEDDSITLNTSEELKDIEKTATSSSATLIDVIDDPHPWERVELWGSDNPEMIAGQEPILEISLPKNNKVRSWFPDDIFVKDGSSSRYQDYDFGNYGRLKSDRYFVLGHGSNWENATKETPVLLVHGATHDMNHAWAHPFDEQTPSTISNPGLKQYLSDRGHAVFAISFPHTQGNNLIQGQLIADAIDVIKSKTGADEVDIVAHSKGNVSSISYMSSLNQEWDDTSWLEDYRGDVRRYIAVAGPLKGLDTMFRYYTGNTTVISEQENAPVAFHDAYIYSLYRDYHRWDMSATYNDNFFQGQTQMLHNWVEDDENPIGFNSESNTSDWNATRNALYYGGSSYYVTSDGIDAVIENPQGEMGTSNFIEKMNNKGLAPDIDLYVLHGTRQAMDHFFWYPIGEKAASSDGLLFTASATYTDGLTRRGANLVDLTGKHYNHRGIAREEEPMSYINSALTN